MNQFDYVARCAAQRVREEARAKKERERVRLIAYHSWREEWKRVAREIAVSAEREERKAAGILAHETRKIVRWIGRYMAEIVTAAGVLLTLAW